MKKSIPRNWLTSRLWAQSGHLEKFREDLFLSESENREYAIKPMNCPCHVQIFKQGVKSYRDLPIRLAEFGCCHRNEPSGTLHGFMRVRGFVQDDAHIFCTPRPNSIEVLALSINYVKFMQTLGLRTLFTSYLLALKNVSAPMKFGI